MQTKYNKYKVAYKFRCSVWENEVMIVETISEEKARTSVESEISGAYGQQILNDLIIKSITKL